MGKEKKDNLDKHKRIVIFIIVVFVLVGSLTGILFPGTAFATIVDNSIGKFFDIVGLLQNNYINILESVAIILFIGILYYVISIIIRLLTRNSTRGETVGILIDSIIKVGFMVLAVIMVLSAWNVPTPTLLAGAGIAGLAASFGAQGILEDVFAGLSIIFEKQFVVGDYVEVDNFRGEVIEIGTRNTRIKDIYGNILIIANSDIREIINLSDHLSIAVTEVSVEYSADLNKVEEIIKDNLEEIKTKIPEIVSGPTYDGVETLADSGVVVRIAAQCDERNRIQVRRDLNKEIKNILDQNGINIPFPQLVLHNAEKK